MYRNVAWKTEGSSKKICSAFPKPADLVSERFASVLVGTLVFLSTTARVIKKCLSLGRAPVFETFMFWKQIIEGVNRIYGRVPFLRILRILA